MKPAATGGQSGFALALALSAVTVVFMLGLAYGARTSSQLYNTNRTVASTQASYLAEAGVEYALDVLPGKSNLPFTTSLGFDTGTVTVTAWDAGNGNRTIRSHADTGRYQRTLTVTANWNGNANGNAYGLINNNNVNLNVVSWTETVP